VDSLRLETQQHRNRSGEWTGIMNAGGVL